MKAPLVPLSAILQPSADGFVTVTSDGVYSNIGLLNRGRGVFVKPPVRGSGTKYTRMNEVRPGQLIYSKLFGWEGSVAIVPEKVSGHYVSSEFPTFDLDSAAVHQRFLAHAICSDGFVGQMGQSTTGMGQRRQRVNVADFLRIVIPLPSLEAQRRIAVYLDGLDAIDPVAKHATYLANSVLPAARNELVRRLIGTPMRSLGDILELSRRPVDVTTGGTYTEIGVRSFGRGLFVKEPISGVSLGSKRVFEVRQGDLAVSNVFGWEGAVAIAEAEHSGLIGSHRFMTWTPRDPDVLTPFVCHYLLSDVGLEALCAASPGSAGRNRTLSIANSENIQVPLPCRDEQEIEIARLTTLVEVADRARRGAALAISILPAARNEVFSSLQTALLVGTAGRSRHA